MGLAVAKALAAENYQVVILGRTEQKLRQAAAEIAPLGKVTQFVCDVADRQQVDATFQRVMETLGPPSILVNSAGINVVRRALAELAPEDWDRILAVHATGTYNCIRAVLPAMRAAGTGLIVNISSVSGKRVTELAGPAYCAGKFAMAALGIAAGLEERQHGIRVTNIYPGEVNTPILEQRPEPVSAERRAQMLQPDDIAQVVLTVVKLPPRAHVWEVVLTPLYQEYA